VNLQTLRYVVTIEQTGSFSKASQYLYVSQSTLSRAVKELEEQLGISLFYRTNQGVRPTHEGQKFIARAGLILQDIAQLEGQYFHNNKVEQASVLLATQRCAAIGRVFTAYYQRYCAGQEFVNLVIQEETTDNILQLVSSGTFGLGILHYSGDREETVFRKCRELQLEGNVFHRSPVVAQVHEKHPLAGRASVTLEDLAPYPHVTYNNENLTGINYCSDIAMYSPANQKKRIVIQDRGALRDIILHTDSYYIGGDYTNFTLLDDHYRRYIPIEGVDFTLNTMWVKQTGRTLTRPEQDFLEVLNKAFAGMPR
jgi:DNA-binding transcriptional LysR family regulator